MGMAITETANDERQQQQHPHDRRFATWHVDRHQDENRREKREKILTKPYSDTRGVAITEMEATANDERQQQQHPHDRRLTTWHQDENRREKRGRILTKPYSDTCAMGMAITATANDERQQYEAAVEQEKEGGIATRTHNHLPTNPTRMNDTDTPQGPVRPDATLGIDPPIRVGAANGNAADIVMGTNDKSCTTQKKTTCMLTGPTTTSIQGDDALVHASQAHAPPPGTTTPPTDTGIPGLQNADTNDVSTHAALHV